MRRIHHVACALLFSACWTSSAPAESPEPAPACSRACVDQQLPTLRSIVAEITAKENYEAATAAFSAGDLAIGIQYVRALQKQFPYSKYRQLGEELATVTYAKELDGARASCGAICDECGCSDGICEASCRKRFAIQR